MKFTESYRLSYLCIFYFTNIPSIITSKFDTKNHNIYLLFCFHFSSSASLFLKPRQVDQIDMSLAKSYQFTDMCVIYICPSSFDILIYIQPDSSYADLSI